MNSPNERSFWARRLDRENPQGLRLTVQVVLAVLALGCFGAIAAAVQSGGELVHLDQAWADHLHDIATASPRGTPWVLGITHTGSAIALTLLTIVVAVGLCWQKHYLVAAFWAGGMAGGALIHHGVKLYFQRERPSFADPLVTELTHSFPSGHSMSSMVAFGFLSYLVVRFQPRGWLRVLASALLGIWILAIGFSRMYLGAHYFSDVMGGFSAGAAWLILLIATLEVTESKRVAGTLFAF